MEREIETGWEWREHNRAKVLACLQEGEYEAIVTTGQSELDILAHLAAELGIVEAVQVLTVKRERTGIPDELLLRTLAVLPFVEALGLSASAKTLFCGNAGVCRRSPRLPHRRQAEHRCRLYPAGSTGRQRQEASGQPSETPG